VDREFSLGNDLGMYIPTHPQATAPSSSAVLAGNTTRVLPNLRASTLLPGVGIVSDSTLESCLNMARSVVDGSVSVPTVSEWKLAVLSKFPRASDEIEEPCMDAVTLS
jgi:hypothetical protein